MPISNNVTALHEQPMNDKSEKKKTNELKSTKSTLFQDNASNVFKINDCDMRRLRTNLFNIIQIASLRMHTFANEKENHIFCTLK